MKKQAITTLFCDIGGVILTNGWDRGSRKKAALQFGFDLEEFNSRHSMMFSDYEVGNITLDEYLKFAVFFQPRSFSLEAFKAFVFEQSQAYPEMLEWVKKIKADHGLKVVMLSNEGKEITEHRMKSFQLNEIGDFFVVSCFIGVRKPARRIFDMALELCQVMPNQVVYLDDRQLFVDIGNDMGMHAICHKDLSSTKLEFDIIIK